MEPTTTGVATGTSLEILAPYLPYGRGPKLRIIDPKGYWGYADWQEDGDTLLIQSVDLENGMLLCMTPAGITCQDTKYADVLPCLRPFAALTQRLPDGTGIVAVELVKDLTYYPDPAEDSEHPQPDWSTATATNTGEEIWVEWIENEPGEDGEGYNCLFIIDAFWAGHWPSGEEGNVPAGPRMTDWLRRHKFAAPVNGKPLVENIDFIPL